MDGWHSEHNNSGYIMSETKFTSKAMGCKINYSFRMKIMEEIFQSGSCIEVLTNDFKIHAVDQFTFGS